ncbi:hypothetical protein K7432_014747 [Basidiobolus ranarum]|uniref:Multiple inositol polyphosphate phosphatase 1 n=1 Tax=Basidiobolus ranarum TaxID=34480 RepID=A0ABR2VP90_9FUNG
MLLYRVVVLISLVQAGVLSLSGNSARYPQKNWLTKHLGTKSPYPIPKKQSDGKAISSECKLEHLHVVARHGTRNPTKGDVEQLDNLSKHFSNISRESATKYPWIKTWRSPFSLPEAGQLVTQGERDLYLLGKRAAKRYNRFLKQNSYTATKYDFASSSVPRSGQSAFTFATGLLEGRGTIGSNKIQPVYIHTYPEDNDTRMAPKKSCPKWTKQVDEDSSSAKEMKLYSQTHIAPIANRLQQEFNGITFQPDMVATIKRACAFEVSIFDRIDTWCTLLSPIEFLTLEYYDDIEDWHKYGYYSKVSGDLGCALLTDFIDRTPSQKDVGTWATFEVGHAETILPLLNTLGLYRDEFPLLSNISDADISRRSFRTSNLAPFTANLIFEFYQCSNTSNIRILHNEVPVTLPGCGKELCPVDDLKKNVLGSRYQCNFDTVCERKPSAK